MAKYMAGRIIDGLYPYDYVISKRPGLKDDMDAELIALGRQDLITQ